MKEAGCVEDGVAVVVIAPVAVPAGAVELPTGKGAEVAVVEVVEVGGGATTTGVVEVVMVLLDVLEELEEVELEVEETDGELAMAEEPPEHG